MTTLEWRGWGSPLAKKSSSPSCLLGSELWWPGYSSEDKALLETDIFTLITNEEPVFHLCFICLLLSLSLYPVSCPAPYSVWYLVICPAQFPVSVSAPSSPVFCPIQDCLPNAINVHVFALFYFSVSSVFAHVCSGFCCFALVFILFIFCSLYVSVQPWFCFRLVLFCFV